MKTKEAYDYTYALRCDLKKVAEAREDEYYSLMDNLQKVYPSERLSLPNLCRRLENDIPLVLLFIDNMAERKDVRGLLSICGGGNRTIAYNTLKQFKSVVSKFYDFGKKIPKTTDGRPLIDTGECYASIEKAQKLVLGK